MSDSLSTAAGYVNVLKGLFFSVFGNGEGVRRAVTDRKLMERDERLRCFVHVN